VTSTWRPFVLRRTTDGDVVRAPEGGWRSALRYGAVDLPPDVVDGVNLIVYPRFYNSMIVTVQVPATIAWEQAVLVRGGFGAPTSPQDGVAVWYLAEMTHTSDLSQQVVDSPLTPGNFYYYSLFLWIGGQWVLSFSMDNAVPSNHGWSNFLFNTLPEFYQRTDDQQAADGRNGPLRVFASVLGYELDYTNTLADGVRDVFNVDRAPTRLLKHLGYNFGVPDEPILGEARQRSMLQQLSELNGLRGTALGMKQLIEAATHYECDVAQSGNQLLAVDDGDFNGGDLSRYGLDALLANDLTWGLGHWKVMTNSTVLATMEDPLNPGQFASSHTVTTAIVAKSTDPDTRLTPPGGIGAMVVNGRGPDIVVACGPVLANDSVQYAIPVEPYSLYKYSARFLRNTWGAQQPPQARCVLTLLWFDATGTFRGSSTGPTLNATDSGTWIEYALTTFSPSVGVGGYDAAYVIPAIWWIGSSAWAGNSLTPTQRPVNGRYVSMVTFSRAAASGGSLAPVAADIFLTLGVTTKTLGGNKSYLGEPGTGS
jgi:phage tail-like protein